jgi:hypothetical protein
MILSNKVKLYIYVVFLFIFTYLFTTRVIHAFKANDFDFLKLAVNAIIIGLSIIQIIRYSKKINNVDSK